MISTVTSPKRSAKLPTIRSMTTTMPFSRGFPTTRSGWNKPSSTALVRAVNEKGYDAVFAEQWKAELSECDIDPEAVSVDSEAHDMENGRDGLDGNAPEKDAPEKDDRDAQPPVDTDNR